MNILSLATLAVTAPLAIAVLLTLLPRLRQRARIAIAASLAAASVSLLSSLALLWIVVQGDGQPVTRTVPWLFSGGTPMVEVGLHIDGISASMLAVVALVASSVQLFSVGYMRGEPQPSLGRYFTYQSLFLFSMNVLVVAPNLLQLFIGWELVGTTSYLLIGYYFRKPSAARAAIKAFWITKFADMGLLVGLLVLYGHTGSLAWSSTLSAGFATAVTLLMFLAVVGKSAQFPLHVWLPDAMEGPTPVSALLHAATMVAAGVYLIVRADPLFAQAPATRMVMLHVGAFTALFAAIVALMQNDIKRVLAYSTCSQLGYMVAALGAGSMFAGYFHLTTHAFFKALLFLAAGSLIHAVHTNDMRKMRSLGRRMRITGGALLVGALSLAGVPGAAGFFSKDAIVEVAFASGSWLPASMLLVAAFLTALYMGRVVVLVFFGEPDASVEHAKESGPSMAVPLLALALPSLLAGYFGSELAGLWGERYRFHVGWGGAAATLAALLGFVAAYWLYGKQRVPSMLRALLKPAAAFIEASAVDRLYAALYRRGLLGVAAAAAWTDRYIVDGAINAFGSAFLAASRRLRAVQTGYVQDYLFAVAAGVVALVMWGVTR